MIDPEQHDPNPSAATATAAPPDAQPTHPPAPEPWTPERVLAWNAYYDLYVALGVLLLVFLVSATKITNSSLWTLLQAGRQTAHQHAPVVIDTFSYTEAGKRWVNIPWIFEWVNSQVYGMIAPADANRRPGQMTQADQYAAGTLVAINATIRVLTALILLGLRRKGPGLWWTAVCVVVALGGIVGPPTGIALGGIAGQAAVSPDTWGLMFLALEFFILHRAVNLGRQGAVWGLLPLFLLWANIDDSFVIGLIVMATTALGALQKEPTKWAGASPSDHLPLSRALVLLAACAAICLLNPSFYHIYPKALFPITQLFQPKSGPLLYEQLSMFGPTFRNNAGGVVFRWLVAQYLTLVGLGLGSFFLNRRRFSLGRFLTFVAMALLWGAVQRFEPVFALAFAATLALNGQEWYHDHFGLDGRLGRGWAIWSIGGRAITIVLTCVFVVKGLTGYHSLPGEPLFGFGVNADLFPFEAADYLRIAPIKGNVLNTSLSQ
ncbi:MAG TPA: hypothetical protein VGZ22_05220, partial [Isosphaeraceae bacterium]|nr:hypothetical protein [Isosphaeraceae bacterium]